MRSSKFYPLNLHVADRAQGRCKRYVRLRNMKKIEQCVYAEVIDGLSLLVASRNQSNDNR